MKKKKFIAFAVSVCMVLCAFALSVTVSPAKTSAKAEAGTATEATVVEFDGVTTTGVYSFEKYAGFDGDYWILDSTANTVTAGTAGRRLGSGTGDNRQVTITLKVNSATAATASLRLWAEFYSSNSSAAVSVNDEYVNADGNKTESNAATPIDLYAINGSTNINRPTALPVTLKSGENVIKIETIANYNMWMEGFEIYKSNAVKSDGTATKIYPQSADAFSGSPQVNNTSWGKETSDAPASATYKIHAATAGYYKFTLGAEAGNADAANAYIKVGDGEKNAITLDTSKGWGKVSDNVVTVYLTEGENVVEIGQTIPEGGSVNWWLKNMSVSYVTVKGITVDVTAAKTSYNPFETVNTNGVTVNYYDTLDESKNKQLTAEEVEFTLPALTAKGTQYDVTVKHVNADGYECVAQYHVSTVSEALSCESKTFDYDGTETEMFALVGENGNVGLSSSIEGNDKIAWCNNKKDNPARYEIGSGSGDGRQLTMTIKVNASVAGKVNLTVYGKAYAEATSAATIKVNDTVAIDGNLYSYMAVDKMIFPLELVSGTNEIVIDVQNGYDMWINAFSIAPQPVATLTLDRNSVTTTYGLFETVDLGGLKATYEYDGEQTELEYDDLTVDASAVNTAVPGTYTVNVSYTDGENQASAELYITVSKEGKQKEAVTISYDGKETAVMQMFAADSKVGLYGDGTTDIYWAMQKVNEELYGDGYEIGSSSDTARRLTLKWNVNSSVKGKMKITLYGKFYASTTSAKLSVNDGDTMINPFALCQGTVGSECIEFEVELTEGNNVIELAFPMNYDGWMRGYKFGALIEETPVVDPGNEPGNTPGDNGEEKPSTDDKKTGCGGKAAAAAAAMVALVGAALVLKKF